ncbi:leucyl aminopeptidase [Luteococcus peritonei]|uniref:Probable cytosol aminopeptidase n=1 Tax=Luteococcus peritonei TaxID=88874 RepID=A0ABW4RRA3_9ACTN
MPSTQLPAIEIVNQVPSGADHVVVGLQGGEPRLVGVGSATEKAAKPFGGVLELARSLGAESRAGHVTLLPRLDTALAVVGLGEDEPTPEQVRRSTGAAVRALLGRSGEAPVHVAVNLSTDEPETVRAAIEGAVLGADEFTKVGSEPRQRVSRLSVVSAVSGAEAKQVLADAEAVARAVLTARTWVNTPANLLYPQTFAEQAKDLAKGSKIEVEVLDEKELARQGFGGILAVGGGSARPPRLVRLDYKPRGARNHLVLVGKGITFDTGGLNLKPAEGMYTMKCDMSGAAAVLAATRAIAELGLAVHVTCYASMAENMPSGSSYRPSDVITMYGGQTVENVNSDAEGRLVMADALARAQTDRPDLVVDVATLTGACMVALGLRTAGLMTSDDATADLVLDAAEVAGEDFWQLPIPEHIRSELDSKVADLKSGGSRYGGAMTAAAFLQRFVAQDTAWAHLDIAGPAFNSEQPYDYVPNGGTGASVRTLVELARSLQD